MSVPTELELIRDAAVMVARRARDSDTEDLALLIASLADWVAIHVPTPGSAP